MTRFQQRHGTGQARRSAARAWVGGQSETRGDVLGGDWAGWASRFVKICRVPGDVVSESVRASQEEIWPLKGVDGWMGGLCDWHDEIRGKRAG